MWLGALLINQKFLAKSPEAWFSFSEATSRTGPALLQPRIWGRSRSGGVAGGGNWLINVEFTEQIDLDFVADDFDFVAPRL